MLPARVAAFLPFKRDFRDSVRLFIDVAQLPFGVLSAKRAPRQRKPADTSEKSRPVGLAIIKNSKSVSHAGGMASGFR